jgi:hypothetical protein
MADLPPTDPKPRPHTLVVAIEIGKRGANLDNILQAILNCEGVTDADECATFDHGDKVREEQCKVWVAADDGVPLKKFTVRIHRSTDYEVLAKNEDEAKDLALEGEGEEVRGDTNEIIVFDEDDDDDDEPKDGEK